MYTVKIDTREKQRGDLLRELCSLKVSAEEATLATGDFWIVDDHGKLLVCLERKTVSDFASSIIDKRFHAQRTSMASLGVPVWGYLVVGPYAPRVKEASVKAILTCQTKLQLYNNAFVQYIPSDTYVPYFLAKIVTLLVEKGLPIPSGPLVSEAIPELVLKRKRQRAHSVYEEQLACIPGVGPLVIEKLVEVYPRLLTLIEACVPESSVEILSNLVLSNGRRLGPKLAHTIRSSLI